MKNQQGKIINWILIIVAFLVIAKIFSYPKPPKPQSTDIPINITSTTFDAAQSYCQGGLYGSPPSGEETFPAHSYEEGDDNNAIIHYSQPLITYKLVRSRVPLYARLSHTTLYIPEKDIIQGKKSKIYFTVGDYRIPVPNSRRSQKISFAEYSLAYVIPLNNEGKIDVVEISDIRGKFNIYTLVDVYQRADKPDFPLEVFDCSKNKKGINPTLSKKDQKNQAVANPKTIGEVGAEIVFPEEQQESIDKKELQLEYFVFGAPKKFESSSEGIWIPGCKPAIYLYPKEKTAINVKVQTKGFLTYTDPKYPEGGWNITAYPDGKLEYLTTNYLYYESKIPDAFIKKPNIGYVVEFNQLTNLFNFLLPKLGLDETQKKDFIDYWTKALPYSAYYSVGIMDQTHIDEIEPLEITPKPDYINRVRIYFEALEKRPAVNSIPQLPTTNYQLQPNFKVVEWGGMVKTDLLHPFTCSQ